MEIDFTIAEELDPDLTKSRSTLGEDSPLATKHAGNTSD
jgi:hypothetical protein